MARTKKAVRFASTIDRSHKQTLLIAHVVITKAKGGMYRIDAKGGEHARGKYRGVHWFDSERGITKTQARAIELLAQLRDIEPAIPTDECKPLPYSGRRETAYLRL